jgi:hypothetical protein
MFLLLYQLEQQQQVNLDGSSVLLVMFIVHQDQNIVKSVKIVLFYLIIIVLLHLIVLVQEIINILYDLLLVSQVFYLDACAIVSLTSLLFLSLVFIIIVFSVSVTVLIQLGNNSSGSTSSQRAAQVLSFVFLLFFSLLSSSNLGNFEKPRCLG